MIWFLLLFVDWSGLTDAGAVIKVRGQDGEGGASVGAGAMQPESMTKPRSQQPAAGVV